MQMVLALLLFWYVLETRRVANETRGLKHESAAQLDVLREQRRTALAPFPVPWLLPQIRHDDPAKKASEYASERAGQMIDAVMPAVAAGGPLPKHAEALALKRQVRIRLEGTNIAQEITLLLRSGLSRVAMKVRAVDLLTTDQREAVVEIEPEMKPEATVRTAIAAVYGSEAEAAAMPRLSQAGDHYVALVFRDLAGGSYLLVRRFTENEAGEIVHGYNERIAL